MDAVKFLKAQRRMCESFNHCNGCGLQKLQDCLLRLKQEPDFVVDYVETWAAEHPAKTYKQDFLEKFPKAILCLGRPDVCRNIVYGIAGCKKGECSNCWNEEMK